MSESVLCGPTTGHLEPRVRSIISNPSGPLLGAVRLPGDKSISHRAVILGAIAQGGTRITGLLEAEDVLATVAAFRAMGVTIDRPATGQLLIQGLGLRGLHAPPKPLDLGNSGTAMRLLAGVLAGQNFCVELTGDVSLSRRPMERVITPLVQMGANVTSCGGCPPLQITPARVLSGINYRLPVASAQVKSAVLLAGLYASGVTEVLEDAPSRDHTERMLAGFSRSTWTPGDRARVTGGGRLTGCNLIVPGDISSAAFFLVAAAVLPGSDVSLPGVGVNPTRTGILSILAMMGADIDTTDARLAASEPLGDLQVRGSHLRGIDIPERLVPLAIDEFPVLAIAAACADGVTTIRGASELRVKESDRIAVMVEGLVRLGIKARALPDGMDIVGGQINGGAVDSFGDHRVAMAFAVAGARARGPVTIYNCEPILTSFPQFADQAVSLGLRLSECP